MIIIMYKLFNIILYSNSYIYVKSLKYYRWGTIVILYG